MQPVGSGMLVAHGSLDSENGHVHVNAELGTWCPDMATGQYLFITLSTAPPRLRATMCSCSSRSKPRLQKLQSASDVSSCKLLPRPPFPNPVECCALHSCNKHDSLLPISSAQHVQRVSRIKFEHSVRPVLPPSHFESMTGHCWWRFTVHSSYNGI